jgi:hypothetical protein
MLGVPTVKPVFEHTGFTVTVTDALAGGEVGPVQVSVYVVVEVGETTTLPLVPVPTPLHDVALVELQVRVDDWPEVITCGLAVRVSVGGGVPAVTVTVACATAGGDVVPVQVSV